MIVFQNIGKPRQPFTSNKDEKTVTIKIRKGSVTAPELPLPEVPLNMTNKLEVVEDFINRNFNIKNFKFDLSNEDTYNSLMDRVHLTNQGHISFNAEKLSGIGLRQDQVVLRRNSYGVLEYSKADTRQEAVRKFK